MKPQKKAIEFTVHPNGVLELDIGSRRKEEKAITELVEEMVQACQDSAFSVRDKIRDQEDEEEAQIVEEETVDVRVKVRLVRKRRKGSQ